MKELKAICKSPPEGITLILEEENLSNIFADIEGPVGTPFEGGLFRCKLALGNDFPQSPPKGWFMTKIFHPNVSATGEICVNTLKKDWKPEHGILHVLLVIRCLLIVPNPESALNEDAGKLLLENYEDYAKRARLMTSIHAKPKAAKPEGKVLEESKASNIPSSAKPAASKAAPKKVAAAKQKSLRRL